MREVWIVPIIASILIFGLFLNVEGMGSTWTPQSSGTTKNLWSINFVDANTGYAVGEHGIIIKTTNGGNTWTAQTSGTNLILYSVAFVDANTGFAVGDDGTILGTTNGGSTWIPQTSGTTVTLLSVEFADANTVYISGEVGTILKTSFPEPVIGGIMIPIDTTALLLAGTQMTAAWLIPVIVSAIGFAIVILRKL